MVDNHKSLVYVLPLVRHFFFILLTSFDTDVNEYLLIASKRSGQKASAMRLTGYFTVCTMGVGKVLECSRLAGGISDVH